MYGLNAYSYTRIGAYYPLSIFKGVDNMLHYSRVCYITAGYGSLQPGMDHYSRVWIITAGYGSLQPGMDHWIKVGVQCTALLTNLGQ